jgi:hypothetical protein
MPLRPAPGFFQAALQILADLFDQSKVLIEE